MYCDKDNQGRYAIMDLDKEQFETIRRALNAYRSGMVQRGIPAGYAAHFSETLIQYERAGEIVRHIEKTYKHNRGGESEGDHSTTWE